MNKNKTYNIANESAEVSQEQATQEFITRTQELLDQLRDGKHILDHAILSAMVVALPEDIEQVTDPKLRAALMAAATTGKSGIETTIGAGDTHRMMETLSRLPEIFSADLVQQHHAECTEGEDCVMSDPEVAKYVGSLKAMAMVYARASGNLNATRLLHTSLKDMGRKALRLAELRQTREETSDDGEGDNSNLPQAIALAGDKAMQFMKLLVESGMLPPEAEEKIKQDLAEHDNRASTGMNVEEHTDGRKVTVVKHGPSTKQ